MEFLPQAVAEIQPTLRYLPVSILRQAVAELPLHLPWPYPVNLQQLVAEFGFSYCVRFLPQPVRGIQDSYRLRKTAAYTTHSERKNRSLLGKHAVNPSKPFLPPILPSRGYAVSQQSRVRCPSRAGSSRGSRPSQLR